MTGMPVGTVVERHNAIALRGSVSFGIRGRAPTDSRRSVFMEQRRRGIPTYFYLVQRTKSGYCAFRGPLLSVFDQMPAPSTFPSYYLESRLAQSVSFWVSVGALEPVATSTLGNLHVDTSQRPLLDVFNDSMASVMFVS